MLDSIVLVVKFTLSTVALFSRDRKELTIMGAKIMSQGVCGLRGILLIMGEGKELQEMEGSGSGETRLLSVRVSTNVCRGFQKVWDIKLECVCVCVFL